MFTAFFALLRAKGLDVSLNEWMTLMQALDKGMGSSGLSEFYFLCRSVLIKSEADYFDYHKTFLEFFENVIEQSKEPLPSELLNWLDRPAMTPDNYDPDVARDNLRKELDEIRRMFAERLLEQKEEHNGGSYWIGTGGMSMFGNNGNSPMGIRVGGQSVHRRAFEVMGEREFADFRQDTVITPRQLQLAFRKLRQFSNLDDAPCDELDLDETIQSTCDNAGRLKIAYKRPRKNSVRLLLLMDSGGSMDEYRRLCAQLFSAVHQSNHFKDLRIYYFHNCISKYLYTSPEMHYDDKIETERVLAELTGNYKTIIFGDAEMSPYELTDRFYGKSGMDWLHDIKRKFKHIVWITPDEMRYRKGSWYRASYDMVSDAFDMYVLTIEQLQAAFKKLMVNR
ncbi:MAG: VWA domain-containing protein [Candidatus Fimivivens sp.]